MLKALLGRASSLRNNVAAYAKDHEEFHRLSAEEQRSILSRRMLSLLEYFGNRSDGLEVWREMSVNTSAEEIWNRWTSLPIVTKDDLRGRFAPELILENYGIEGSIKTTGGSSGVPTRIFRDRSSLQRSAARTRYLQLQFGWRPGLPILCLWGSPRDMGRKESLRGRITSKLSGFEMINGFEFDEKTVDQIQRSLERHPKLAIYGYTTLLERASRELINRGIQVPKGQVVTAWSAAEPLHDYQSDLFLEAFGTRLHDQYGGREVSALAYRRWNDNSFHLMRPDVFFEVVNEKNEWCRPGETGRLLITDLTGKGTPLIRYENGDLATFQADDIDESGITGLTRIDGRISNIITLPNGKGLHSIFWGQTFSLFEEIHEYHVHQKENGSIEIRYIGAPLSSNHFERLHTLLDRRLAGTPFTIEQVDTLPKTPQGKYLRITSDYKRG